MKQNAANLQLPNVLLVEPLPAGLVHEATHPGEAEAAEEARSVARQVIWVSKIQQTVAVKRNLYQMRFLKWILKLKC